MKKQVYGASYAKAPNEDQQNYVSTLTGFWPLMGVGGLSESAKKENL